jgi:hypothetical protein
MLIFITLFEIYVGINKRWRGRSTYKDRHTYMCIFKCTSKGCVRPALKLQECAPYP